MNCLGCPQVPVVSVVLAHHRLQRLSESERQAAAAKALEWLLTRHEGVETYAGIHGRPYTDEEKDALAVETQAVAGTPCPFFAESGCIIGGLGPHYNRVEETGKAPYGWLPTLVARECDLGGYKHLVVAKEIADVKVALLTRNEGFLSKDKRTGQVYVG